MTIHQDPEPVPFTVNSVATGTMYISGVMVAQQANQWVQAAGTVRNPTTNFQLAFWKDAKARFARVRDSPRPDPAELVMIIASLGFSVTFLFGANFTERRKKTPNLAAMTRDWGLRSADRSLHRRFVEFESFFTDKLRHTDRQKMEQHLVVLDVDRVRVFMRTVQETWLWFQRAFYSRAGVPVPEGQIAEFQDDL